MLRAYFDESGHAADSNILALGGFLGTEAEWFAFDKRWRDVLVKYGAQELHAAKIGRPYGPYSAWTEEQSSSFLADAVSAITSSDLLGISHSVIIPDFQRVIGGHRWFSQKFGSAYRLCYEGSIQAATNWIRRNPNCRGEELEVVFASNAEHGRAAHVEGERYTTDALYPEVTGVHAAPARDVPALQAADLLAYETYRYTRAHFFEQREPEPRGTYRRLLQEMPMAEPRYWDAESLIHLCTTVGQEEPGLEIAERVSLMRYLLSLER